jgi:hypothetical protein
MTLSAKQTVGYRNSSDGEISEVKLNLYPNAFREGAKIKPYFEAGVDAAYPDGINYGGIDIKSASSNGAPCEFSIGGDDKNILSIKMPEPIKRGASRSFDIEYTVKIPKTNMRFGYYDGIINLTNFFPTVCVLKDGQFAECAYLPTGDPFFSQAADFDVTLTTDRAYLAAHSGDLKSEKQEGGGRTFGYKAKNIRDFALCLSESFAVETAKAGGVEIKYYYLKGGTNSGEKAGLSARAIKFFSEYFFEYPYKTYCLVETFITAGGMEYPNLVFINKDMSESDKETVIVHETAHQWWYGIVGSDNLSAAWMDEGLTEFSTELFFEKNDRRLKAAEYYRGNYAAAKRFDQIVGEINPGNITMEKHLSEFVSEYEYVVCVYSRGHLLFKDLFKTVTEQNFKKAVKYYVKKNKYKIASADGLTAAFNKYYKGDVRGIFSAWINFNKEY